MNETVSNSAADAADFIDVRQLAARVGALELRVSLLGASAQTITSGVDPQAVIKAVEALEVSHGA